MESPTRTKAMSQERIQTNMNFSVKPKFTATITNDTKNVVTKLIKQANFNSFRVGSFGILSINV